MTVEKSVLYLVHDPMCSWCWAFRPAWQALREALPDSLRVEYLLGGLAPDSDVPMPVEMQQGIAGIWRTIEQAVPGTRFNHDFWSLCKPRRSTYPACRAVICAGSQGKGEEMVLAIQQAYYLKALNPSDDDVLLALAVELGLEPGVFAACLQADETQAQLLRQIRQARQLGGYSFPSLFLRQGRSVAEIPISYTQPELMWEAIQARLTAPPGSNLN